MNSDTVSSFPKPDPEGETVGIAYLLAVKKYLFVHWLLSTRSHMCQTCATTRCHYTPGGIIPSTNHLIPSLLSTHSFDK